MRNGQAHVGPDQQCAFGEREVRIAQQRGRVRADLRAEAFAGGAPAERAVEREVVRVERVEAAAAFFAGQVLAVDADGPARLGDVVVGLGDVDDAFAEGECVFDAAGDARAGVGADDDAVDDDFDRVLAAAVDRGRLVERVRFAVDAHADVAAAAERIPERFVLLADGDFDRGHDVELRAARFFEQLVDDLIGWFACRSGCRTRGNAAGRGGRRGCGSSRRFR